MSLLDDCSIFNSFEDINDINIDINKNLEEIDNLIDDIELNNTIIVYNNFLNLNAYFFLMLVMLNDEKEKKQLVIYNKYGFDSGYNLYKLYLIIIDLNVRFLINFFSSL